MHYIWNNTTNWFETIVDRKTLLQLPWIWNLYTKLKQKFLDSEITTASHSKLNWLRPYSFLNTICIQFKNYWCKRIKFTRDHEHSIRKWTEHINLLLKTHLHVIPSIVLNPFRFWRFVYLESQHNSLAELPFCWLLI